MKHSVTLILMLALYGNTFAQSFQEISLPDIKSAGNDTPLVVINEFSYTHPYGDRMDYIELKNNGPIAYDLSDFVLFLLDGDGMVFSQLQSPTLSGTLQPGERFLIGSSDGVDDPDATPFSTTGQNLRLDSGGITLIYNPIGVVDMLSYGAALPFNFEGDPITAIDSGYAFMSFSRIDELDTQNNANDFQLTCMSPGSENSSSTSCPRGDQVKFNEFDDTGSNVSIEVINKEDITIDLTGYKINVYDGIQESYQLDGLITPNGYRVFQIPALLYDREFTLEMPSPSLLDTVIDRFTIGDPQGLALNEVPTHEGFVTDPDTSEAYNWSRIPNGTDTDQIDQDFKYVCSTIGEANVDVTDCAQSTLDRSIVNLQITPNPATKVIFLSGKLNTAYSIFNSVGQTFIRGTTLNGRIDIGQLPGGVYFLRSEDVNGIVRTGSFVKN